MLDRTQKVNLFYLLVFVMFCLIIHFLLGIIVFSGLNYGKLISPIVIAFVNLARKLVSCRCGHYICIPYEWQASIDDMLDDVVKPESENQIVDQTHEEDVGVHELNLPSQHLTTSRETPECQNQDLESQSHCTEPQILTLETSEEALELQKQALESQELQIQIFDTSEEALELQSRASKSQEAQILTLDTSGEALEP